MSNSKYVPPGMRVNIPTEHRVFALNVSNTLGDQYGKWEYITYATNQEYQTSYSTNLLKRQVASLVVCIISVLK